MKQQLVTGLLAIIACLEMRPTNECLIACSDNSRDEQQYVQISGIYPHLAVFNQPVDPADRPNHGECGIGAIAVWADRLWYLTYPQHKTMGSNDKLYELDAKMNVTIRPESVGGTHAGRMIHRESEQLILGPYFIDKERRVRAANLTELRGRMTAIMRHLEDPAHKVYFFDMEGAIYEVDVETLAVEKLFVKPVPGWHGKGGYTAQGRVVIANNGEVGPADGYRHLLVGKPAQGEEAGVLAEWDGKNWRIVERKQFCDVTGPGGIVGSPDDQTPLWAIGWDKRSVILKLLDRGQWFTYRLPKGSHTFDPRHGWYTEWPRIREISPGRLMLCMHGQMFDFPTGFSAQASGGIRPICTHLRYIPDLCHWNGRVVLGADDASMMQNPMCGQAQSNLWFGDAEDLRHFGPATGWGGVWMDDAVMKDVPSDPFLIAGYQQRVLHLVQQSDQSVTFYLEVDRAGDGNWSPLLEIEIPPGEYRPVVIPDQITAEWLRVRTSSDCRATAYFHGWSPRPTEQNEDKIFAGLADATSTANCYGGLIRPAAHNRNLQWLIWSASADGGSQGLGYREIDITPNGRPILVVPEEDRSAEVEKIAQMSRDFEVDDSSVIVRDSAGKRWRLPRGPAPFDRWVGKLRAVREVASERFLANIHGTFYEIPRDSKNQPDWSKMKPVCSHSRRIVDFCSWRGLLVLAGVREDAPEDGHVFGTSGGPQLWFGCLDDLWKLGRPRGEGGPWSNTLVTPNEPSDPYLMTGFARKTLELTHDANTPVRFTVEVDFDHTGFRRYAEFEVPPRETLRYDFGTYHAHWVRLRCHKSCRVTARLLYE
ncbi:MAG: hypothetical protein ACUVQG_12105 [Thermogutta sp.]